MLIVTTDGLAGYEIRSVLGEALGVAVQTDQARGAAPGHSGSSATFRMTGETPAAGLAGARREAVDRLGEEARRKGANVVLGMRFETVALAGGGHEVCAYGTAVWAEAVQSSQQGHSASIPQAQQPQQPHQQQSNMPPYGDSQPGGPPMAARNLTIGLHDRPR
ncbi:YbjQ family protein [Actinomadura sp. 9N407]|uniref:YbjQ family protein n=1 Tax=Actinomadura sp. 9N407 TaxID=3375154 RepID=UPI0037BBB298